MLVTVLTAPFDKVVVYMICWVTDRGDVAVVLVLSEEVVDFTVALLDDVSLAEDVELGEEVWPCNSEEDEDGDWGEEIEPVEGERVEEEDAGGAAPEV